MSFDKEIKDVGHLIIEKAQDLLRLNGAYRSGRLHDSFEMSVSEDEDGLTISIRNTAPYAGFINNGTYQWKGSVQQQSPIIRKYESVKPAGYPNSLGGYPFNKKGIEPINFIDPIKENLDELNPLLVGAYTKKIQLEVIEEYKAILLTDK